MAKPRIYVCEACIEDSALQDVVRKNYSSDHCDYCERTAPQHIACELEVVTDHMRDIIEEEYTDPGEELPYESAEGGYQGNVLEGYHLFDEIGFEIDNTTLFDDIVDAFVEQPYCKRDYFDLSASEYREAAWKEFKRVVMHQRRYTFWSSLDESEPNAGVSESFPAGRTLPLIATAIHEAGPVIVAPAGTAFWRVRLHDQGKSLTEPAEFTPPPVKFANQPNRMSPAGIPMFYGAEDFDTAVVETVDPANKSGKAVTGGKFASLVPLTFLDLTSIPQSLSFFAPGGRSYWHAANFLRSFAIDVSRPIKHDGRQHIEYVPTQVFTEFVRYELKTPAKQPYHGIKYRSSRNNRPCYVVFVGQPECLPDPEGSASGQVFNFVDSSLTTTDKL